MVSLIVAKSKNNVIGNKGRIPWYIPNDLKRFKELTTNNVVIMGRKTFESLPKEYRPLPNRVNIILSNDKSYNKNCCIVCDNLKTAIKKAGNNKEIFIIGGGEVYKEGLKYADRVFCHCSLMVLGTCFTKPKPMACRICWWSVTIRTIANG